MSDYKNYPSIMQDEPECFICGKRGENILQHHELFFGSSDREKSIKSGLWVYLCANHHTGDRGVHKNPTLNYKLKKAGQERFEKIYSHQIFMKVFKKNYLDIKKGE